MFTKISKFNAKDIDPVSLRNRAKNEANAIWNNPKSRRGRTYKKLLADCMLGQAAEINLLNCGYKDNTTKYMDVKEPDETTVEVKVITNKNLRYVEASVNNTLDRCAKQKLESLSSQVYEFAKKIYMYTCDEKTPDYNLIGIYEWNDSKKQFIGVQKSNDVL
jgi:hypothetical protein